MALSLFAFAFTIHDIHVDVVKMRFLELVVKPFLEHSSKAGAGLSLAGILELVRPTNDDYWITFYASRDDFAASIPADPTVIETGVVIYGLDEAPLPVDKGGPTRFLIPNPAAWIPSRCSGPPSNTGGLKKRLSPLSVDPKSLPASGRRR